MAEVKVQNKKSVRIHYLDGVRGVAALSVVFYHFIGWRWQGDIRFHIGAIVFNGSDAVSFFFVLSGLVLSYKYFHSNRSFNIPDYIYRRVFRLYPAFIFTIMLNYLYWNRHSLGINTLLDIFLYNKQGLWEELLMIKRNHKFYIPGWTLGVEMALSLLVPLFTIVAKKNVNILWWLLPIVLFIGNYLSPFAFHFILGILLAYYFKDISNYNFKLSKYYKYRYLLGVIVFILYSSRHLEKIFTFGSTYFYITNLLNIDFFIISGIASSIMLMGIINNERIQNFFTSKVMIFLGRISYGVYLMHWLVVVYVMEHWDTILIFENYRTLRFIVLLGITVIVTLVLATIVHYFVEELFIKISKKKWLKSIFRIP